jgi:hypothetical protein
MTRVYHDRSPESHSPFTQKRRNPMPQDSYSPREIPELTLHPDGRFSLAAKTYDLWEELRPTRAGEWTVSKPHGPRIHAEHADGARVTCTYDEAGWTTTEDGGHPSQTCQPVSWESHLLPMTGVQKDEEGNDIYTPWATCQLGDIVFKGDGVVMLAGRAFVDGQRIDGFRFTGGVAKRQAGFKQTLAIEAADGETYYFGYRCGWWYRFLPIDAQSAPKRGLAYWIHREIATHGVLGALVRLWQLAMGLVGRAFIVLWVAIVIFGLLSGNVFYAIVLLCSGLCILSSRSRN